MSLSFYLAQKEKYQQEQHKSCISKNIMKEFENTMKNLKDPTCPNRSFSIFLYEKHCGENDDAKLIFNGVQEKLGDLKDYVKLHFRYHSY